MSKQKFEVGDKVTIVDKYRNKYNSIVGVGEVTRITPTNNRLLYTVRFKDKAFEPIFYSYELNLYTQTFKVGDKVKLSKKAIRYLKSVHPKSRMLQGKTYIIESFCSVGENNIKLKHVSDYMFESTDLVRAEEEKKERKFKTGDKVYIAEQAQEWMIEHGYKKYLTPGPKEIVYVGTYKDVIVYDLKGIDDLQFYIEDLSTEPVKMLVIKEDESKEYKGLDEKEYRARLTSNWKEICNRYLEAFCNKHGYKYEPDMWVGSDPGTIVEVCDMFVSMDNIRYDVDNNIPDPDFEDWYWKSLELHELGVEHWMNFPSYCKGAPDEWTEERMKNLRTAHQRVDEAKKALEQEIKNFKSNKKLFFNESLYS